MDTLTRVVDLTCPGILYDELPGSCCFFSPEVDWQERPVIELLRKYISWPLKQESWRCSWKNNTELAIEVLYTLSTHGDQLQVWGECSQDQLSQGLYIPYQCANQITWLNSSSDYGVIKVILQGSNIPAAATKITWRRYKFDVDVSSRQEAQRDPGLDVLQVTHFSGGSRTAVRCDLCHHRLSHNGGYAPVSEETGLEYTPNTCALVET